MKRILYSTLFLMSLSAASYAVQCGNTGSNEDRAKTSTEQTDGRENADQRKTEND